MVYMRLISNENGKITYAYMPETETAPLGVVSYSSGSGKVEQVAPDDKFKDYAYHAIYAIRQMVKEGSLLSTTSRAWA